MIAPAKICIMHERGCFRILVAFHVHGIAIGDGTFAVGTMNAVHMDCFRAVNLMTFWVFSAALGGRLFQDLHRES